MRRWIFCSLFMLSAAVSAQTAEPQPVTPAPAAPTVAETPAPPPKPKAVEKPVEKPAPKPRPAPVVKPEEPKPAAAAPAKPAKPAPAKPVEQPPKSEAPAAGAATHASPASATAFGCWALAFAMLIAGFAAGFFWRHQMSRHKLGGMTVRIGTWRGIP